MRKLLGLPIDWFILAIPIILCVTGIVTIYTITYSQHHTSLAINQMVYALLGLTAMLVLMFTDYRFLASSSIIVYLAGIALLLPLLPTFAHKLPFVLKIFGAYRWINLGVFQLQPAEIFKLIVGIFGANYLAGRVGGLTGRSYLFYLFLIAVPVAMILLQPDLGTAAIVLIISLSLLVAAKPSRSMIISTLLLLVLVVPIGWTHLKPYQKQRLETFANPSADPQGQGYNVRQSVIAVGSGGLTGRGFGQGSQTILNFLPVPHADFIFAGFAEATGFVGSAILIILYVILLLRITAVARESTDVFGQLLAVAIAVKFFFQILIHIGMNVGLFPVTGIPLPFMSYGGTAIIIDFAAIGIIESIAIRHKRVGGRPFGQVRLT